MSPREVLSVVIAAASNPGRRTALQGCLVVDEVLDGKGALFHSRRRRTPLKVNRRVRCCVLISVAVSTQGENEGEEKESAHRDDAGGGRRHGNRRRGAGGRDGARGTLTGAAEGNGAGDPNQGDLDGSGEATLNLIPK
jgi:hypothetical protein